RLLGAGMEGRARVGSRDLSGGDIAVLVRSHTQGRMVRECLAQLGVASVQRAQDNVFHAPEAAEIERVLMAVAEPGREALVRAALVTEMLGRSGDELDAWSRAGDQWERQLERFHRYRELWVQHGFVRMFRQLLSEEQVATRLLRYPDGERRLTNLFHLAELLHANGRRQRSGMEGLLTWLADRRRADSGAEEETQLRLESDENLVKIVTIHGSKGLQYPIVFCPFLWDGKLWSEQDDAVVFHDPDHGFEARLDMGSAQLEEHRTLARREELAENIRLAYVALTRAEYRCYLTWGAVKQCEHSALAWLFHRPAGTPAPTVADVAGRVSGSDDRALREDLERMAADAADVIEITDPPDGAAAPLRVRRVPSDRLSARVVNHRLPPDWRISSFSALASAGDAERPDYDAAPMVEAAGGSGMDFFGFPRGSRAGQCLHTLLERVNFRTVDRRGELESLARRTLREYRFSEDWVPVLVDAVGRVVRTPLDDAGTLSLAAIGPAGRVNEMEFYYPLGEIAVAGLKGVLRDHGFMAERTVAEEIDRLSFSPTRGFMKGFIDLVFEHEGRYYLADYKSNWLGDDPEAYRRDRLPAAMGRHGYSLQYLIYAVALHRYLARRVPHYSYARCFGGVYYLFLRGMDPARGNSTGVFQDRPSPELVQALDSYLATGADRHVR
ncbi:MAG: 3'-5' exonuclease, partial [Gammaproteobacteria bacterium]